MTTRSFYTVRCITCVKYSWRFNRCSKATGTAAQSPFVIAFNTAGVKGLYLLRVFDNRLMFIIPVFPHIINACVFTSAFSAGNSFLFCGSRILYGLALRGQAPKIFAFCTRNGLPIIAVLATVSMLQATRGMTTHYCCTVLLRVIVVHERFKWR